MLKSHVIHTAFGHLRTTIGHYANDLYASWVGRKWIAICLGVGVLLLPFKRLFVDMVSCVNVDGWDNSHSLTRPFIPFHGGQLSYLLDCWGGLLAGLQRYYSTRDSTARKHRAVGVRGRFYLTLKGHPDSICSGRSGISCEGYYPRIKVETVNQFIFVMSDNFGVKLFTSSILCKAPSMTCISEICLWW